MCLLKVEQLLTVSVASFPFWVAPASQALVAMYCFQLLILVKSQDLSKLEQVALRLQMPVLFPLLLVPAVVLTGKVVPFPYLLALVQPLDPSPLMVAL
jgi:hypothetical protein